MAQWHYQRGGEKIGPVSSSELKRLAESGELSSTDMVWRDGNEPGVRASRVSGLFPTEGLRQAAQGATERHAESSGSLTTNALPEIDSGAEEKGQDNDTFHSRWKLAGTVVLAVLFTVYVVWYGFLRDNRGMKESQRADTDIGERTNEKVSAFRIKGGAWLTKQTGMSDPIRGLKIYFVKSHVSKKQEAVIVASLIDEYKTGVENTKITLEEWRSIRDSANKGGKDLVAATDKLTSSQISICEGMLDGAARTIKIMEEIVRLESTAPSSGTVDTKSLYDLCQHPMRPEKSYSSPAWEIIVVSEAAFTTHTDIDGKYSIEIPRGNYYAYARHDFSHSVAEWLVPVDATESKDVSLHFYNETAAHIRDKGR